MIEQCGRDGLKTRRLKQLDAEAEKLKAKLGRIAKEKYSGMLARGRNMISVSMGSSEQKFATVTEMDSRDKDVSKSSPGSATRQRANTVSSYPTNVPAKRSFASSSND